MYRTFTVDVNGRNYFRSSLSRKTTTATIESPVQARAGRRSQLNAIVASAVSRDVGKVEAHCIPECKVQLFINIYIFVHLVECVVCSVPVYIAS